MPLLSSVKEQKEDTGWRTGVEGVANTTLGADVMQEAVCKTSVWHQTGTRVEGDSQEWQPQSRGWS